MAAEGTVDDDPSSLLIEDCLELIDCSLGFESNAGFLGIGGAGFRLTLDADDAMDATDTRLGDLGSWGPIGAGAPPE